MLSQRELEDLGFEGFNFTWCNNRDENERISKRLDRHVEQICVGLIYIMMRG